MRKQKSYYKNVCAPLLFLREDTKQNLYIILSFMFFSLNFIDTSCKYYN